MLVIVLWVVALMSVMVLALVAEARDTARIAAAHASNATLRPALSGAIYRAIAEMSGIPLVRLDAGNVAPPQVATSVSVSPEAERIDLNTAPNDVLMAAFGTVADEETARELAARVQDWRDADNDVRANGAEFDQYVAAGYEAGPRNGRFIHASEIHQVLGVSAAMGERLMSRLTVYGRSQSGTQATVPAGQTDQSARTTRFQSGHVYRVDASGQHGLARAAAQVTVLLTGEPSTPYLILSWSWGTAGAGS